MFFVIFVAVSGESVLILNNLNLFWISVVPMFQVLLMLGIWKLSPWVKRYFEKHKAPA